MVVVVFGVFFKKKMIDDAWKFWLLEIILLSFALKPTFTQYLAMHPTHQSLNTYFMGGTSLRCVSARTKGLEAASCELPRLMVTTTRSIHRAVPKASGKKLVWTMPKSRRNNLFLKQTLWAIHRTMKWRRAQWFTLRKAEGETLIWWIQKTTPSCAFSQQCWAKSTFYSLWAAKL